MKTITLKTDEYFFDYITDLATKFHLSKSELIRRSVKEYAKVIEKKELKKRFKSASMKTSQANLEILKEYDETLNDGLENV